MEALLDTASWADENSFVSVDFGSIEWTTDLHSEDDYNPRICVTEEFSSSSSPVLHYSEPDSLLSSISHVRDLPRNLFWTIFGGGLAIWAQIANSKLWSASSCSFSLDTDYRCWVLYGTTSLVTIAGVSTVGGFGGAILRDLREFRDERAAKERNERLRKVAANYGALDEVAELLAAQGMTLLSATGYHGELTVKVEKYGKSSLTWREGNETKVELFEAGAALEVLRGRYEG